jgi:hypothetical protein
MEKNKHDRFGHGAKKFGQQVRAIDFLLRDLHKSSC